MLQKPRLLIGLVLLVAAAAFFGWAAGPASAAAQPGSTPILDNFNRANENPLSGGGNWSALSSGGAQLLNNAVASNGTGTSTSGWKTSYNGDVEARTTVLISTNNAGVMTHVSLNGTGQLNGYLWQWQGGNSPATFALYRADANVFTTLATFDGFLLDPGDQLALQVIGSSVQGWVYHLGSWQQVASAIDTTYRTGKLGLRVRGTTAIADDFGGGQVQTQAHPPTVVSLTFDDSWTSQTVVGPMLSARGMRGTFFVNSGNVGGSGFLTWPQLQNLQSAGNEIAGHTINHVDLTTVDLTEAQRQVCQDRRALLSQGLNVSDFAYPYGAYNTSIASIVQGCGYNSARRSWGLCAPAATGCPAAETIPPLSVWEIRTQTSVRSTTTVQDLENAVTAAEATGGWVTFVFHYICDGCDSYSITQSNLQTFLDWLQPRSSSGTTVKTVRDVIGGSLKPPPTVADQTPATSSIACNGSPCSSWYAAPISVSLSSVDSGTGIAVIRYTTDGTDPTATSPIYSGPFSVDTTTTVKFRAWDNAGNIEATQAQMISLDTTAPFSSIACNGSSCSTDPYSGGVTVSLSTTDVGSGAAAIRYTTDGSTPDTSSPLYISPFSVSTTTTVKFRAWDVAGNVEPTKTQLIEIAATTDQIPPSSSIACNGSSCSSGWYSAGVTVVLSATDSGSGVAVIRYTTDGSDPTDSSPTYQAPFVVAGTTTVKYRAWDVVGNVEPTNSQLIQVDPTAPTSSIACKGSTCSTGWYGPPVAVSLAATDTGSGVAAIRYTTDGSSPTASSPLYTSSFNILATATVKYRAWDVAGNLEPTNSQLIQVDSTAPSASITSPSGGATVSGNVRITASAADSQSGVATVAFYVDSTLIGTSSSSPWQVQWNTKKVGSGQHVLTAIASDRVGNRTTSAGITVTTR
jgi:peptidoglycan/xylan/chitin deacetylase (PgdA/CDA1 family)